MKENIERIFHKYINGRASVRTVHFFLNWLVSDKNTDEKEKMLEELWKSTAVLNEEVKADSVEQLKMFYQRNGISKEKKTFRMSPVFQRVIGYAAIIAVVVTGTLFVDRYFDRESYQLVEYRGVDDDVTTANLPDGTEVTLNESSTLLLTENYNKASRDVYLFGEGYFKVKKDPGRKFVVHVGDMEVVALGTEFNVQAFLHDNKIVTSLVSGSVQVALKKGHKDYILNPGQQIVYDVKNRTVQLETADIEDVISWKMGVIKYTGKSMQEILNDLEYRFNIKIIYNANLFNEDKYTLSFDNNADIEEIMSILSEIIGNFSFKLDKGICYIMGK